MPRAKPRWDDPSSQVALFIGELARTAGRHDRVRSNPLDKARAFAFRARIYVWRRSVLDLLSRHNEESRSCLEWLHSFLGPRVTAQWLELSIFQINQHGHDWFVEASIQTPCYGPDIRFEDSQEFKDDFASALALIKASRLAPADAN